MKARVDEQPGPAVIRLTGRSHNGNRATPGLVNVDAPITTQGSCNSNISPCNDCSRGKPWNKARQSNAN